MFFTYCTELIFDIFVQVLFEGGFHVKVMKTTAAVFPRWSRNRESNNDDKHGHGPEKRRPSTCVEGKT